MRFYIHFLSLLSCLVIHSACGSKRHTDDWPSKVSTPQKLTVQPDVILSIHFPDKPEMDYEIRRLRLLSGIYVATRPISLEDRLPNTIEFSLPLLPQILSSSDGFALAKYKCSYGLNYRDANTLEFRDVSYTGQVIEHVSVTGIRSMFRNCGERTVSLLIEFHTLNIYAPQSAILLSLVNESIN